MKTLKDQLIEKQRELIHLYNEIIEYGEQHPMSEIEEVKAEIEDIEKKLAIEQSISEFENLI